MNLVSNIFSLVVTNSDGANAFIHAYDYGNLYAKTVSVDGNLISTALSGQVNLGVLQVGSRIDIDYVYDNDSVAGVDMVATNRVCFCKSDGSANTVKLIQYPSNLMFTTYRAGKITNTFYLADFNNGGCISEIAPDGYNGGVSGSIFDFSDFTQMGAYTCSNFNRKGALTSLPEGSFRFNINEVFSTSAFFMEGFNSGGKLQYLPTNSFNFENLVALKYSDFSEFNANGGALGIANNLGKPALPTGSFRFPTTIDISQASNAFYRFNYNGWLQFLPYGSFNWVVTTAVSLSSQTLGDFNFNGELRWSNDPNKCIQLQNFSTNPLSIDLVGSGVQSVPPLGFVNIIYDTRTVPITPNSVATSGRVIIAKNA